MFITISDTAKGKPFKLQVALDGTIAIHRIDMWIGYYNINQDQTCRYVKNGESQNFTVKAGLYNFDTLVNALAAVDGIKISANKIQGLVEINLLNGIQVWLTEPIKNILGIDRLTSGEYKSSRPPEFTPKRLLIYLKQLSTTENYESKNQQIRPSQLLVAIPLTANSFGALYTIKFDNPLFKKLQNSVYELDFDFKIQWSNGDQHKLDNHELPIDLMLEIK